MNSIRKLSDKSFALFYFKLGCLLFWASWFFVAFLTNFFDFMYIWQWLPLNWHYRSGNYDLLKAATHMDQTSFFLNALFVCDIIVLGLSAILFFLAFIYFWLYKAWEFINAAFALSIALWGVFIAMEEIFLAYGAEKTHIGLFVFELLTLMAIHLLPHRADHL